MRLCALGKNVDVQRSICQLIGEFEPCGHSHAATLPMIVHDRQDLFLGRRYVPLCCGLLHGVMILSPGHGLDDGEGLTKGACGGVSLHRAITDLRVWEES